MRDKILFLFLLIVEIECYSQDADREYLSCEVLYRNVFVPNQNVINVQTETATITNEKGEFGILVKVGDELVFTAVNYQMMVVRITPEILDNKRLVVEVNEKVTELDEVVVTPENQEKFLQVTNRELLLKEYEYETDRSTQVENISLSQTDRGMRDGLN